jgi:glycosyltransferase involved in cell wall biosynthesis
MPKVSLGILAHNEQARIPATLRSLESQSLFGSNHDVEVVVVPNGCKDQTAAVTREIFGQSSRPAILRNQAKATPGIATCMSSLAATRTT